MRLGQKLILGYAFLALLLLALALLAVQVSQDSLKRQISRQSIVEATQLLGGIDRYLHERIEDSRLYARAEWIRQAARESNENFAKLPDQDDWIDKVESAWLHSTTGIFPTELHYLTTNKTAELFRDRMRFYKETYGYSVIGEIFLTNRYGANVAQSGWTSDYRQNDESWWHAAKEQGTYIGDIAFDESAKVFSTEIAVRVEENGKFLGVMKIVLNIDDVIDIIRRMEAAEEVYMRKHFNLLTRDGRVIYSTDGFGPLSDRAHILAQPPPAHDAPRVMERVNREGKRLLSVQIRSSGYRDFPGLGWILVVERLTEDTLAPVREMRNRLWLFGAITFALALIMGGMISATFDKRLMTLRKGMKIVASGDLGYRLGTRHRDEVGELSREFDRMTSRLRETTVSRDNLAEEVAERRRAEARLKDALAELERSNRDLEQYAYAASHDLREPLRKIRGFADLLNRHYRGTLDEKAERYLRYMTEAAARLETLIGDLLTYARVGQADLEIGQTDMGVVVQNILADLERAIEDSAAVIEVGPMPKVMANERQISLVLQNLILNAIKFRGERPPRISIKAEQRDNMWVFSVRDNGIGMKKAYFEKIFQLFQRLHTREEYSGTGIGLAVCKKIVERHGGRIWVESVEGEGSCFYFSIPAGVGAAGPVG